MNKTHGHDRPTRADLRKRAEYWLGELLGGRGNVNTLDLLIRCMTEAGVNCTKLGTTKAAVLAANEEMHAERARRMLGQLREEPSVSALAMLNNSRRGGALQRPISLKRIGTTSAELAILKKAAAMPRAPEHKLPIAEALPKKRHTGVSAGAEATA